MPICSSSVCAHPHPIDEPVHSGGTFLLFFCHSFIHKSTTTASIRCPGSRAPTHLGTWRGQSLSKYIISITFKRESPLKWIWFKANCLRVSVAAGKMGKIELIQFEADSANKRFTRWLNIDKSRYLRIDSRFIASAAVSPARLRCTVSHTMILVPIHNQYLVYGHACMIPARSPFAVIRNKLCDRRHAIITDGRRVWREAESAGDAWLATNSSGIRFLRDRVCRQTQSISSKQRLSKCFTTVSCQRGNGLDWITSGNISCGNFKGRTLTARVGWTTRKDSISIYFQIIGVYEWSRDWYELIVTCWIIEAFSIGYSGQVNLCPSRLLLFTKKTERVVTQLL